MKRFLGIPEGLCTVVPFILARIGWPRNSLTSSRRYVNASRKGEGRGERRGRKRGEKGERGGRWERGGGRGEGGEGRGEKGRGEGRGGKGRGERERRMEVGEKRAGDKEMRRAGELHYTRSILIRQHHELLASDSVFTVYCMP